MSCSICLEFLMKEDQVFLPCLHLICLNCLNDFKHLEKVERTCKTCNEQFNIEECQVVDSSCSPVLSRCLAHPTDSVVVYCEACQELICDTCMLDKQHQHQVVTLKEALTDKQDEIQVLLQRLTGIDAAIASLESFKQELKQRLTTTKEEIESAFEAVIKTNAEFEKLLYVRVAELKEEATKLISSDIKTIELQLFSLQTTKEHIKLVGQYASLALTNVVLRRIKILLLSNPELMPIAIDNLRFFLHKQIQVAPSKIGKMGQLVRYRLDWTSISQPSIIFGATGTENGFFMAPYGIAQLDNGNFVVADCHNKRLQMFTSEGQFLNSIFLGCFLRSIAFSVVDDLIWCASSDGLLGISLEGQIIRRIEAENCFGMTVSENGLIVGSFIDDYTVRTYSSDGNLVWTSIGNRLTSPHGLTSLNNERIIVCDSEDRLQILSSIDGHFVGFIAGNGALDRPSDVTHIPKTDLIVVVQSYRVSILTLNGSVVHKWGSKGHGPGELAGCRSVLVLNNGQVAIVDTHNDRVQIF